MGEWKSCSLGDVITFQRGYDLPKSNMRKGEIPVVGSNGIIGYHNEYTTEEPSITIGRSGNVGKPFIFYGKTWSHNTTLYIKEFYDVDPVYVFYLLQTLDLGKYAGGSAVPTLNRNHIHTLPICIPEEISEQKAIANILKTLDEKIDNNISINNNLEQQAHSCFQELFVDNANPEWETGTISNLGLVVGGSTPSKAKPEYYTESGIAWITPKDLSVNKSKFIAHGENDITELGLKNSSASIMPEGTVLFSSRAPIGYIAIATCEVTTNQGFKSVVPKTEIGTAFVYFFLKHNLPIIEGMASGSTFKEISGSTMKSIPAVIPDSETLAKFNDFCIPIFTQQRILEEENQSLAALRNSLLPKLISGDIDVSTIQL